MIKNNSSFEKAYFTGHYAANVGNFTLNDLRKSINWFTAWLKFLNRYVDLKHGNQKKVLEVGCSIGAVSNLLYENGFEVYASDISSYSVKRAKKLTQQLKRKITFSVFDVQKPIPIKEKFDIIFCFEVLEHLTNPEKAIINMKNKLTPKGILICSTPNGDYDQSLYTDPTHINVKSPKEWQKIFKSSRFSNILISQVSFLPYFYKFSKYLSFYVPFGIEAKYFISPVFIIAKNN